MPVVHDDESLERRARLDERRPRRGLLDAGDGHANAAVRGDVAEPGRGRLRVEGDVRGARLQDPVDAGDGVQLLVEVQPDAVSPPDTQVSQHMRERVRARVQLPVCLLPIAAAHGDALTVRPRRTLEQPVENGLAQRPRCRATMLRCISEVPEWIRVAIASRTSRSSSYSVM